MHTSILWGLIVLLQIANIQSAGKYDPRGAYISLHAKWNSTPLLHEAAEFLVWDHIVVCMVLWRVMCCGMLLCVVRM